jgi:hypothetical protein
VIVEDGRIIQVNEHEVLTYAREMGAKLWDKI